jgi:hypothetical protein
MCWIQTRNGSAAEGILPYISTTVSGVHRGCQWAEAYHLHSTLIVIVLKDDCSFQSIDMVVRTSGTDSCTYLLERFSRIVSNQALDTLYSSSAHMKRLLRDLENNDRTFQTQG